MSIEEYYLTQLQRKYSRYLSSLIEGLPFEPIRLLGGKARPTTTKQLEEGVCSFLRYQKTVSHPGWEIIWETWTSKKLGVQQWPSEVVVTSETDLLYLLKKEKEVGRFRSVLQQLESWNHNIRSWLLSYPQRVLELQDAWAGIIAVVDYLLQHDVSGKYVRSLPVPVHTKFIQQNSTVILSILKHLAPNRFTLIDRELETALGLSRKPFLFTLRWLDGNLADLITSGIEVIGVSPEALQAAKWPVKEIWVVENETNLYLLPMRPGSLAVFAKGYALHHLQNIPLFHKSRILYWGDLDEDGFRMLHQFRQLYPKTQSLLMDEATVNEHLQEIQIHSFRKPNQQLELTSEEEVAWQVLKDRNGRIEQEQIRQDWIIEMINNHK